MRAARARRAGGWGRGRVNQPAQAPSTPAARAQHEESPSTEQIRRNPQRPRWHLIEPGWKLCIPSSADAQALLAGESAPVAAAPASGEPIIIGASLPLSGRFSEPGSAAKQGYEVWAAMINEAGGLLGRPVELSLWTTPATRTPPSPTTKNSSL